MIEITFNAFSFVREKLKKQNIGYLNNHLKLANDTTPHKLIEDLGLIQEDVEAVFINGKVLPKTTPLQNGDRVALVPPGTPGSYRITLGIKKMGEA